MMTTELTSLAARDEIEIAAIRHPGDLTTVLTIVNDQRGSSSGRVWFLVTKLDVEAPCLVVGVRGERRVLSCRSWMCSPQPRSTFAPADVRRAWTGHQRLCDCPATVADQGDQPVGVVDHDGEITEWLTSAEPATVIERAAGTCTGVSTTS